MKRFLLIVAIALLYQPFSFAQSIEQFNVYFASGSSKLTYEDAAKLSKQMEDLQAPFSKYTIHLTGHTDHVGNKQSNEILSQQRCEAVRDFLLEQNIDNNKITFEIFADERPLLDQKNAHNRRVEISFEPFDDHEWRLEDQVWNVDPQKGGTFVYERSGSVIQIPPNALLYENGSPVEGMVQLRYKEFRDPVDFLVSKIPMEHEGKLFNSAGMFDIDAHQKGEKVVFDPNKQMQIDLVLSADSLEDVSFFTYDEGTNDWTTIGPIDPTVAVNEFDLTAGDSLEGLHKIDEKAPLSLAGVEDTLGALIKALELGYELANSREDLLKWHQSLDISQEERWRDVSCASNGLLVSDKWYENISRQYRTHIYHNKATTTSFKNKKGISHKRLKKDVVIWLWDWESYEDRRQAYRWWYSDYKKMGAKDPEKESTRFKKYEALDKKYEKLMARKGIRSWRQYELDSRKIPIIERGLQTCEARLKAQQWLLAKKGSYPAQELYKKLKPIGTKGRWWADYRVEHLGGEQFQIVLKGWREQWDTLLVTPVLTREQRRNSGASYQQIIADCNALFVARKKAMQDSIDSQKEAWKYLLAFSDVLKKEDQKDMTEEEWMAFCSRYPLNVKTHYRKLKKVAKYCKTYQEFVLRINNEYLQQLSNKERSAEYTAAVFRTDIDNLLMTDRNKTRRLRFNRFGICNLDQLLRIPPPIRFLDMKFKNESSDRKIVGESLAVINYNLNTVQYYRPQRVPSLPQKGALYLVARNGRKYVLRPEAYHRNNGQKQSFKMEDVTTSITGADDLRKTFLTAN